MVLAAAVESASLREPRVSWGAGAHLHFNPEATKLLDGITKLHMIWNYRNKTFRIVPADSKDLGGYKLHRSANTANVACPLMFRNYRIKIYQEVPLSVTENQALIVGPIAVES